MTKNPLISVIIPIYNVQDFLPECIDSIIHQTYKNIEIILVDDGSTDKSGKIADEYARKDKRIKVIHKKNGGQGSARNEGLKIASGDYIGFVDGDDFVDKNYYKNLIDACDNDDIIITNAKVKYHSEKDLIKAKNKNNKKDLSSDKAKEKLIYGFCSCCNKIFKRDFLIKNDIKFYPKANRIEDNYFTIKAYVLAKSIKSINNAVYYWRMRRNSSTKSGLTSKDFICFDIAKGIECYKKLAPKFSKIIDKKITKELSVFYDKLPLSLKNEFKLKFKKEFPNLKIKVCRPLKWLFRKYKENETITLFGDRIIIGRKR